MKIEVLLALASLATALPLDGVLNVDIKKAPLFKRDNGLPDGVLTAPVAYKKLDSNVASALQARGQPLNGQVSNQQSFYQMDIAIGTPAQKLSVLVDTGSSDLWVYGTQAKAANVASFNSASSGTFKNNGSSFSIQYVQGSASGNWATDVVQIDGANLKSQTFAMVTSGTQLDGVPGILGIGLPAIESISGGSSGGLAGLLGIFGGLFGGGSSGGSSAHEYSNVPDSLHSQGFINSPTFSLYLNDYSSPDGTLIFGGVDHAKYSGPLYVVPRVSDQTFSINMAFKVNGQETTAFAGILDSGTTIGSVPTQTLNVLVSALGLQLNQQSQYYYTTASAVKAMTQTVTLDLGGGTIAIPAQNLFVLSDDIDQSFPTGQQVFAFQPTSATGGQIIIGDVFLRNLYLVYDHANPQIAVALAKYDTNESNIEAISGSTIPGGTKIGGSFSSSSSSSSSSGSGAGSSGTGSSGSNGAGSDPFSLISGLFGNFLSLFGQ